MQMVRRSFPEEEMSKGPAAGGACSEAVRSLSGWRGEMGRRAGKRSQALECLRRDLFASG